MPVAQSAYIDVSGYSPNHSYLFTTNRIVMIILATKTLIFSLGRWGCHRVGRAASSGKAMMDLTVRIISYHSVPTPPTITSVYCASRLLVLQHHDVIFYQASIRAVQSPLSISIPNTGSSLFGDYFPSAAPLSE